MPDFLYEVTALKVAPRIKVDEKANGSVDEKTNGSEVALLIRNEKTIFCPGGHGATIAAFV